jgi:hypothetical protein
MTGGHGLTRPLTATTKTPRRANKQPLRTCLTGFWMRFHSEKGISGLRLVEAVRVTQSTLADGPSEHRTISLDSC